MSNTNLAVVEREESIEVKNEIALMVGGKKKESLTSADRIYYGVPESRGSIDADSSCNLIYNCYYISVLDEKLFGEVERSYDIKRYEKFLLDFFYRRFMGYENHYFRAPKDEVHRLAYNKMAVESGHPEWVIKAKPKPDTCSNISNEPSSNDKSDTPVESLNAEKVDVLDADGNVIAEDCDTNAASKKPEKGKETTEQPKQEANKDEQKNGPKRDRKNHAEPAASFVDASIRQHVDSNRSKEFKDDNDPIIKNYPELQKVVDACNRHGKVVHFRVKGENGLVHATIFNPEIPNSGMESYIDPAKVRDHYSFITGAANPYSVFPFEYPMASFDKYLDKYIETNGNLPAEDRAAIDDECVKDYKFLYHLMYSSVPKADLDTVARILAQLFLEIDRNNLSLRFKAIDYTSKYSFTLDCNAVGLGRYAKDNARFSGMKIIVRAASETSVTIRVSGDHAQEFRDIIFNNSLGAFDMKVSNDAKTPEQKDNEKPNPEQENKQEKKPEQKKDQSKPEKKEPVKKSSTKKQAAKKAEAKEDPKPAESEEQKPITIQEEQERLKKILDEKAELAKVIDEVTSPAN